MTREQSQEQRGTSTRWMLLAGLVLVIASITLSSLLVIGHRMHQQVLNDFSENLDHSVETFQSFERQRLAALVRENALLADLPKLKAVMTTSDERTIADDAVEFWKAGDFDLFALASSDGHVVTTYTRDTPEDPRSASQSCRGAIAAREALSAERRKALRVLGATFVLRQ